MIDRKAQMKLTDLLMECRRIAAGIRNESVKSGNAKEIAKVENLLSSIDQAANRSDKL